MNNNRGFSLIELLVATAISLLAISGFLMWTAETVKQRSVLSKANMAYSIAVDVVDRLSKLSETNSFLLPRSGNDKYVAFDANTNAIMKCSGGVITSNAPQTDVTGMTEFTNPWAAGTSQIYLYDNNQGTLNGSVTFTTVANTNIDHPNASDSVTDINNIVNPIRKADNGITYYVVWSVAYMPCMTAPTNIVKIFVTVYWLEPEPFDSSVATVNAKIASGAYSLKNMSLAVDKALGAEQ